jgi:hypothetical protein
VFTLDITIHGTGVGIIIGGDRIITLIIIVTIGVTHIIIIIPAVITTVIILVVLQNTVPIDMQT